MPWHKISRKNYALKPARCASDPTDAKWALIAPDMPLPNKTGRPREWPVRETPQETLNC